MKRIKTILVLLAMSMTLFACKGTDAKAASDNGVSVNVPAKMEIVFNEDGTASVSEMYLENDSLVPVEVQNVTVAEFNNWKVVPRSSEILVNSKQLSLKMGEKELQAGNNAINQKVAEQTRYDFDVTVNRGAWTETIASEKALELEMEYEIGTKQFNLNLDANGGAPNRVLYVYNGANVNLPEPKREGYQFDGWQDEDGTQYTDEYVMPIGDVTLTAIWRKLNTYAIFSSNDGSLTFVKTADEIKAGQTYNGKAVTTVYTGFEEKAYTSSTQVPWYADGKYKSIKSVVVKDVIKPISTAYWFYYCESCASFDVKNLDTSKVTTMRCMYGMTGRADGLSSYTITGMDTWDTSQVTDMYGMFEGAAIKVSNFNIGNVGKWDVSNVTNMCRMFSASGMRASTVYIGDLSSWNTGKVENTEYMFSNFGYQTPSINIGNIGKWNVSSVTNMYGMFRHFCYQSTSVYIGDLSGWNVGKVTDFGNMFYWCAMYVPNWNFGNLGNWNVSSGTAFSAMFDNAGCYSKTFYVGDLQKWNTANAVNMGNMFECAGESASWSLNCRNWNVKKVTYHVNFNKGVEGKVTAPAWVN